MRELDEVFAAILMGSLGIFVRNMSADALIIAFARLSLGFLISTRIPGAYPKSPCHQASHFPLTVHLEPVTATLIGVVIYAEPMSLLQALGGSLIILSGLAQLWVVAARTQVNLRNIPNGDWLGHNLATSFQLLNSHIWVLSILRKALVM